MKIYLSGPMTGKPYYNREAFLAAADFLRAQGHAVFSPWEHDAEIYGMECMNSPTGDPKHAASFGFSLERAASDDTQFIIHQADAIALLPDWEHSLGVFGEWSVARWMKRKFMYLREEDFL